jgi:predicted SprT family Zn-dependent metalloprotease
MAKKEFSYATFEEDTYQIWICRIQSSFYDINREIMNNMKKELKIPSFAIKEHMGDKWGTWEKDNRVLSLNVKLLKNFEWGGVERVIRHEVAHMIVDEIIEGKGRPHGELFKLACEVVGVPSDRLTSESMLIGFKGTTFNSIADKVRKLMIHGNNEACTKQEAEIFLDKAQELMIRHNLKVTDINGNDRFFVKRPIGPTFSRQPVWLWQLATIVIDSCNVQGILMGAGKSTRIELYGEPNNLDVAEYIFCSLLVQGEYLYEKYLANHKAIQVLKKKRYELDPTGYYEKDDKPSSATFLMGLYSGYKGKMDITRRDVIDRIKAEEGAIVVTNDKLLREMYEKEYHPRKGSSLSINRNSHFMNGVSAGKSLTLSKGVGSSSSSSGKCLNA